MPIIEENISGIFNYCVRWCERCPFTMRCANFDIIEGLGDFDESEKPPVEEIMRDMPTQLDEVIKELKIHCENAGYDWSLIHSNLSDYEAEQAELNRKELGAASRNFMIQLFRLSRMMGEGNNPASWRNPIEVLKWYGTFLNSKVNRAIGNPLDPCRSERDEGPQSAENGSAKLALLSMSRALAAVTVMLREPGAYQEELLTIVLDLLRLQQSLRFTFPNAAAFERPGFDEPEYEVDIAEYFDSHLPIDPFRDGPWIVQGGRAPSD